jgi:ankyrin repeat protein
MPAAQLIAADADNLPLATADASRHTLARPSAEYPLHGASLLGLLMAADTEGLARLYANPKAQIPGFPARNQPILNLYHGPRPLMVAAYEGNEALVNWLLANGSPVDQKDDRGWTASDYARWAGHDALAERLARTGSK